MHRRSFLQLCTAGLLARAAETASQPNVVLIYADDLGYGDVGCYGARLVKTPHIDRLAERGLRFTNAHSSSATCTPSRYSMLTGQYAWRKKGTRVLPGDAALILEPGRPTLASIFKDAGYSTACIGKWHLGLGSGNLDWNGEIRPGPLEVGFDYSFIMPPLAIACPASVWKTTAWRGWTRRIPSASATARPYPASPPDAPTPSCSR
ncbi:MAG: sulfatase-like hydrolase/transferase [Rhodospirillales bacterium]